MSVQTFNSKFKFELPSLSYIDAKREEPNLRSPAETGFPVRKTGFAGWLARRADAIKSWRGDSRAATELAMMSDHDLMDIGISRSDLNRVFKPQFNEDLRQRTQRSEARVAIRPIGRLNLNSAIRGVAGANGL